MDHIFSSTGIEDPLWAKIWRGSAGGDPRTRKTVSAALEEHRLQRKTPGFKFCHTRDFPDGAVVKNPPANAGDMGSSPGLGRSHMPRSN